VKWFRELVGMQNPTAAIPLNVVASFGSEEILDMLRSSYSGVIKTDTTVATFENNARAFFGALSATELQNPGFELLTGQSAAALASLAIGDAKYRNALKTLSIFAIDLPSYTGRGLDLYNPATGTGDLTEQYLADRAAFLANKITANNQNTESSGIPWVEYTGNPQHFEDRSGPTLYNLYLGPDSGVVGQANLGMSNILFGGAFSDGLLGGSLWDKLYGMDGNDNLTGGKGNDYLEGGQGADTYLYTSGDGTDTILDTDHLGQVNYDGTPLTGGKQTGDKTYRSDDGKYTYTLIGTSGTPSDEYLKEAA
jgi:hypothetical protein